MKSYSKLSDQNGFVSCFEIILYFVKVKEQADIRINRNRRHKK